MIQTLSYSSECVSYTFYSSSEGALEHCFLRRFWSEFEERFRFLSVGVDGYVSSSLAICFSSHRLKMLNIYREQRSFNSRLFVGIHRVGFPEFLVHGLPIRTAFKTFFILRALIMQLRRRLKRCIIWRTIMAARAFWCSLNASSCRPSKARVYLSELFCSSQASFVCSKIVVTFNSRGARGYLPVSSSQPWLCLYNDQCSGTLL